MLKLDLLVAHHRRLLAAKALSDLLVLETLQFCCNQSVDTIPKKYVLMDLCHNDAWDQAALWVLQHSFPTWSLEVRLIGNEATVRLLSPHVPAFVFEAVSPRISVALLSVQLQAVIALTKLGLESQPR